MVVRNDDNEANMVSLLLNIKKSETSLTSVLLRRFPEWHTFKKFFQAVTLRMKSKSTEAEASEVQSYQAAIKRLTITCAFKFPSRKKLRHRNPRKRENHQNTKRSVKLVIECIAWSLTKDVECPFMLNKEEWDVALRLLSYNIIKPQSGEDDYFS